MENIQEINFDDSIYGEIIRLGRRDFEIFLDYYKCDHGYVSGDEFDTDEINNNVDNLKGDER